MPRGDELPDVDELRELGGRVLQDLREPLEDWLRRHAVVDEGVGADGVVDALAVSVGGLRALRPGAGGAGATRFAPEDVEVLTARVLPALAAGAGVEDAEELEEDLRAVWYRFLTFLERTGRWAGAPGHLETCLALLDPGEVDVAELLVAAAEQVGAQEEDATVLASFPVRAAAQVLARVGAGLPVPEDEELAPADVAAVLAALGLPAADGPDGPDARAGGGGPHLEDVPWLHQLVLAMLDLELLDGEDEALLAPGPRAATWRADEEGARELRRDLVGRFVLDDPATLGGGFSVAEAVLPTVLASAVAGEPFDEAALEELLEDVADLGPAAGAALEEVRERLADLAGFGVVSERSPWTVPRGFWPALASGIAQEGEEGVGGLFGEEGEPHWFESVADSLGLGDAQKQRIRDVLGGG
ncbi:hypothetical protein [Kineococcus gypseus]|uniref:hypothetical protein n=1 Tax=Kineococcus gypseus TaxID=1637102 RepID=UPI003D7C6BA9